MKLSERIKDNTPPPPKRPTAKRAATVIPIGEARTGEPSAQIKERAQEALLVRLGSRLYDASLPDDQLHKLVVKELTTIVAGERAPLSPGERHRLVEEICDDVLGYGPIEKYLDDPNVSEVMVNGADRIYVERAGKLYATDDRFLSDDHLRRVIDRMASQVGRRVDESSPMVDARLADGSRINAIVPPLAVDGPSLTIRKFAHDPFTVDDLIALGTLTREMADVLERCVRGRLNILVSGGTGTGKTTLLNVLSSFVPHDERIVTIEDAVELQLRQDHVVRLECRPMNIEGKGEISTRDLMRNALRMRPDRIIVGEVRGAETLDMLQAMNTGHDGSLSTVHANSPRDALSRLETMVLMGGIDLPSRAIREQAAAAIDVIVQLTRLRDGTRRITHLTEVSGMESDVITLQDVFLFDFHAGVDAEGNFRGHAVSTGIRPGFAGRLKDMGHEIPAHIWSAHRAPARRTVSR
jgi:pilus assembly protein CpaF